MLMERPIIFPGPMVRAIRAGQKTETRMVAQLDSETDGNWSMAFGRKPDRRQGWGRVQPGDLLWVRETYALGVPGCEHQDGVSYRADHLDPLGDGPAHPMRWRASTQMPRWASRITLRVLGVRPERLHDITEDGVLAEGVEPSGKYWSVREDFVDTWDHANGKRAPWGSNPWVWVIRFEVTP